MKTPSDTRKLSAYVPPGVSQQSRDKRTEFQHQFPRQFHVPHRLARAPKRLVREVNVWHYAMINDTPRNEFYYRLLQQYITPETGVLDIGAGSGLLSLMSGKLGAKWVVAVEGSPDLARLAKNNVESNSLIPPRGEADSRAHVGDSQSVESLNP
jgi:type III protein arginine methyltransferase